MALQSPRQVVAPQPQNPAKRRPSLVKTLTALSYSAWPQML